MYDDLHTYGKPGHQFKNAETKQTTIAQRAKPAAKKASFAQNKDLHDGDPNSVSEYDAGLNIPYERVPNYRPGEEPPAESQWLAQKVDEEHKSFSLEQFNKEAAQSENDLNAAANEWKKQKESRKK